MITSVQGEWAPGSAGFASGNGARDPLGGRWCPARGALPSGLRVAQKIRFGLRFASRGLEGPDNTHPRLASFFERLWRDMIWNLQQLWLSRPPHALLLFKKGETPILPSFMNGGGSLAR